MPARLDIALQRNEGWARSLYLTDDAGQPIDLSSMTVAMQVREKLTQALVAEAAVTVVDPANGEIAIELAGGSGSALGSYGSPIQTVNLHHDLRMTDGSSAPVVLFAGTLVLSRGETI